MQQLVGRLVVQRDKGDVQRRLIDLGTIAVDGFQRPVDHRQGSQAEEVELHQARRLNVILVELGYQATALFVAINRREVGQFGRRDNHTTGVLADVTHNALKLAGHFPDFGGFFIDLDKVAQDFFLLEGFFQGHAHFKRNHLRQTVRQAVGLALHPRHVTDNRLGGHRTEGDDLAYRVAAVFFGHIFNYPVATIHAEVDVEVGHRYPFRVKETFEQQVVFQRVKVGNLLHIGHQRSGTRPPARPYRYAVALGPLDKVHHDQEVTGEAHLDDDIQLEIQPVDIHLTLGVVILGSVLGQQNFQPLFQAIKRHLAEILIDGHAIGDREVGQKVRTQLHFDIAALGNFDRICQRLGQVTEQLGHFLGAFQILLVAVILGAARVIQRAAFTNANAGFVGFKILLLDKAHIVGGHQGRANLVCQGHSRMQVLFVIGTLGALHFEIEAVRKYRHPFAGQGLGFFSVATDQRDTDLALLGCRQHDQAICGLGDPFTLNDHLAIALAIDVTTGNQLGEVAIAQRVHRQQADTAEGVFRVLVRQPQVCATDRLDPAAHRRLVELDQGAHVVLISHRDGRHIHAGQGLDQRFDPHQAIDQGVFSVQAQVNE